MSRHFRLRSELSRTIVKRLPHAKNQLSVHSNFFNQFVTDIYAGCLKSSVTNFANVLYIDKYIEHPIPHFNQK